MEWLLVGEKVHTGLPPAARPLAAGAPEHRDAAGISDAVFLAVGRYHAAVRGDPRAVIPIVLPGFLQRVTLAINLGDASNIYRDTKDDRAVV